ncbi:hypothetical protein L209DRAFT_780593 [Thermothelomyces heterothallicus CBS 203.75]
MASRASLSRSGAWVCCFVLLKKLYPSTLAVMTSSAQVYRPSWKPNSCPPRISFVPPDRPTLPNSARPRFRMRPEFLPPLIIPKRRTRTPILVATCPRRQEQEKQQQQQQDEEEKEQEQQPGRRPLPIFRSSYRTPPATLPATAFPNPPPERKPDDFDDIEAFSFYNPCLLPPSPVAPPFATRSYTDPSHGIPPLEPAPAPPPPPPFPDYSPQRWRQQQRQEEDPLPPPPRPGSAQPGLRRSTQPLNRDYRRRGGNRAAASVPPPAFRPPRTHPAARPDPELPPSPFSIQRSPSRLYARPPRRRAGPGPGPGPAAQQQQQQRQISLPRWDTCGPPGFEASRPPSPVVAAHPRPAKPPVEWDAKSMSSSVYSMYTDDVVQSPYYSHSHNNNDDNDDSLYDDDDDDDGSSTPGSWGRRDGGGYVTPCLAVRPPGQEGRKRGGGGGGGGGGEGGYKEREAAALRDLWGVIDELLGPDRRLGDYDAMSITSSMNGEMAAAAAAAAAAASAAGDHSRPSAPRASYSNRESRRSGVSGEGAWWRAVRQGLLLS